MGPATATLVGLAVAKVLDARRPRKELDVVAVEGARVAREARAERGRDCPKK